MRLPRLESLIWTAQSRRHGPRGRRSMSGSDVAGLMRASRVFWHYAVVSNNVSMLAYAVQRLKVVQKLSSSCETSDRTSVEPEPFSRAQNSKPEKSLK